MNPETKFWLETSFQTTIEVSLQLSQKPCSQQTPFQNKYQAIEKLKSLVNSSDEGKQKYFFIVYCALGQIYSDVEQTNDSVQSYSKALKALSQLPKNQIPKFLQYFLICHNMLGLSFINRDENQEGLGCLCKAYEIYEAFHKNPGSNHYHNRSQNSRFIDKTFKYFYEGGNDFQHMDECHTLTLFYLAQAYTKIGLKDKAAEFCGMTLQRQYATQKYELKQFCNNLIGLSEYYTGKKYYSQAQYLLLLGTKILPEGGKKKMRALLQIQLGKVVSDILEYSVERIKEKQPILPIDIQNVNRQCLKFKSFEQQFPQVNLATDLEGCKSLFRKSNTQLKKALEVFVLDGFVTQHLEILTEQSKLYKTLSLIEKSRERVMSMLQKRKSMLEPLLNELNPKAYPAFWQKILVEVSQIYNDMFTIKSLIVLDVKNQPSEVKLDEMNRIGIQSISYFQEIIKVLEQDKDAEKNEQYYRSLINSRFNIAKTQSKCMSLDKKIRVEFLKEAYKDYQELVKYIQGIEPNMRPKYTSELELTNEMVAMLPNKIDKINAGMVSPLE